MKKSMIFCLLISLFILCTIPSFAKEVVLNYYSHAVENGTRTEIIEEFEKTHPGIKVNLVELPMNTSKKLQTLSTIFQAQDSSIDIFDADVIWPPIFASAGWVEPLDNYFTAEERAEFLDGPILANTYMNKIWGVPYRTDAGILYYRTDLLEKYNRSIPNTWNELVETSLYIMEQEADMKGIAGSWAQYEGLVCNALEIFWSYGAKVLDEEGNVVLNSPEAVEALQLMVDMVNKDKITPDGIINFFSGDARAQFFAGKLIFMRDWPSGWRKSQDPEQSKVVGKVGMTPLPTGIEGGRSYSTLGGWQIMVSNFSKHKKEAAEFAKFRASYEAQKIAAIGLTHLPSRKAVYADAEVLAVNPYYKDMYNVFLNAYPRPKTPFYAEVSSVLQVEIQKALTLKKTAEEAIKDATKQIEEILNY